MKSAWPVRGVSRVQILNAKTIGKHRRLESLVLQSYKNKVPLLHKEFLWQDRCSCRQLREGKSYIVMGMTEKTRGNEVKLVLDTNATVRKVILPESVTESLRFRQDEMKYCRKWRRSSYDYHHKYSYKSY
ncbi:hypothetical protein Avbf_10609 [Armadillidium vulgare]|nr:hypothetical protein Avbf_10609 [Armadillidium vulgare]